LLLRAKHLFVAAKLDSVVVRLILDRAALRERDRRRKGGEPGRERGVAAIAGGGFPPVDLQKSVERGGRLSDRLTAPQTALARRFALT
jgi:hypothetical protein